MENRGLLFHLQMVLRDNHTVDFSFGRRLTRIPPPHADFAKKKPGSAQPQHDPAHECA